MKEKVNTTLVEFEVIDKITGEIVTVEGKTHEVNKYYSIKKITTRIHQMDFTTALGTVATSVKQLGVIAMLLDMIDSDNRLLILNQVTLSKELECSKKVLSTILSNLAKSELAVKENKNIYHINPYIYIGKRTRSNEAREQLQLEWPAKLREFKEKKEREPKLS